MRELIHNETQILPREKVFLGGLSQGCAAAVYVLLTLDSPLGGFIGMSGWFPFVGPIAEILDLSAS